MTDNTRAAAEERVARYLELAAQHRGIFNEQPDAGQGDGGDDGLGRLVDVAFAGDAGQGDQPDAGADTGDAGDQQQQQAAEPAWAPDPNEWQQVVATVGHLGQLLSEAQQAQQAQEQQPDLPDDFDPYDPQQLTAVLQQMQQRTRDEILQAISPVLAPVQQQTAQTQVDTWLAQAEQQLGAYDKEAAAYVAHGFLPLAQGNAQVAVHRAAAYIAEHDKQVAAKAVEQFKNELRAVSGADTQPDGGGTLGAAEIVTSPPDESLVSFAKRLVAVS